MVPTRRAYLASFGVTATASIAGCLGGGGNNDASASGAGSTSHECTLVERDPVTDLSQPGDGPTDATVTVDVFEDFACPHCAEFATGELSRLKTEYLDGGNVRFRHFDFPIPVSEWSGRVANAARSVQQSLGDAAFFEFSLAAYENQSEYAWQLVGDLAEAVDADPCRVLSDASNATYEQVLSDNRETGVERGVTGTPGVFVNETLVERPENGRFYNAIRSEIDANL